MIPFPTTAEERGKMNYSLQMNIVCDGERKWRATWKGGDTQVEGVSYEDVYYKLLALRGKAT